ncbi:MAG TPA: hypothetical protein VFE62_23270 [Gemmataceae bacterium]|nr:hypothetical protein [Gemmataceae bacterium]
MESLEKARFCQTALQNPVQIPPDLQAIIDSWMSLPEILRVSIVAMVQASKHPQSQ